MGVELRDGVGQADVARLGPAFQPAAWANVVLLRDDSPAVPRGRWSRGWRRGVQGGGAERGLRRSPGAMVSWMAESVWRAVEPRSGAVWTAPARRRVDGLLRGCVLAAAAHVDVGEVEDDGAVLFVVDVLCRSGSGGAGTRSEKAVGGWGGAVWE